MKKFLAVILGISVLASSISFSAYADELTSEKYTVDSAAKIIGKVAPLTTVVAFTEGLSEGAQVVNVDGSVMTSGYATDNVFVKYGNDLYKIETKALYQPLKDNGSALSDGTEFYNQAASELQTGGGSLIFTNDVLKSGFNRVAAFGKIGTGSDNPTTENTVDQTLKAYKDTYAGKAVYRLENNSNNYAYLRTHAGYRTSTDTDLRKATETSGFAVTSVTFTADKLGNISLFHNLPQKNSGTSALENYDASMAVFYSAHKQDFQYIGNAVQFTEDGKIKVGGVYDHYTAEQRTPAYEVGEWEANKEYNISVVQKSNLSAGNREGRIAGIYINGERVFPTSSHTGDGNGITYVADYDMYRQYAYDARYGDGISSVMLGTAPKTSGENMTVAISDFEVYSLNSNTDFDAAITKENISLHSKDGITVTENDDATKAPAINDTVDKTVAELRNQYSGEGYKIGIYNTDGTMASDTSELINGMVCMIASEDGLQGKSYTISVPVPDNIPASSVYTVNTDDRSVSGVGIFTTVGDFLANFTNGSKMSVVNIDGTEMTSGYATENVYLKAPDGALYKIIESYAYAPLRDNGEKLINGTEIYNYAATEIAEMSDSITAAGIAKIEKYGKIGTGRDNPAADNTEDQTVKAVKNTENGQPVYVMENDSNNYIYLRSHFTASTRYSTSLQTATGSWELSNKPIVTTMSFEADKYGTVSLFHNVPVRDENGNIKAGDSGIDSVIYSVENPYVPSAVHFMEDGKVMLGGIYSDYPQESRTPVQDTGLTWEPGNKYTVSVVQRFVRNARESYVDGVYINGEKVFPNDNAKSHADGRVALQTDGSFKVGTNNSSNRYGGGLSSIMIGTASKTAGDNFMVKLTDVKVYTPEAFNADVDKDIAITADGISVNNNAAIIGCDKNYTVDELGAALKSSARIAIYNADGTKALSDSIVTEGMYVKAVSEDGLASKTYSISSNIKEPVIKTGFYAEDGGEQISSMAEISNNIWFVTEINNVPELNNEQLAVILAVYDKDNHNIIALAIAEGVKNADEKTVYKANIDISSYGYTVDKVYASGFVWKDLNTEIKPVVGKSELK